MSAVQNKSDCLNAMYIVLFQLRPTSAVSAVIKYQSNFSSFNSALLSNKYLQKQQVYFQQATESNFSGRVSDMCVSCSQCDVRQVFAVMLSLLNKTSHHRCRTPHFFNKIKCPWPWKVSNGFIYCLTWIIQLIHQKRLPCPMLKFVRFG